MSQADGMELEEEVGEETEEEEKVLDEMPEGMSEADIEREADELLTEDAPVVSRRSSDLALRSYLDGYRRYPSLQDNTPARRERVDQLFRQYRSGSPKERQTAFDLILCGFVRLAAGIASRFKVTHGLPMLDLVQEGMLEQAKGAIPSYDPAKGCYSFFAFKRMWGVMNRAILRQGPCRQLHISEHRLRQAKILERVEWKFRETHSGQKPDEEELLDATHALESKTAREMKLTDIRVCHRLMGESEQSINSFSDSSDGSGDDDVEGVSDSEADTETVIEARQQFIIHRQRLNEIARYVDELSDPDATILRLYLSLDGQKSATSDEIAERFQLSSEDIRRIQCRHLQRLISRYEISWRAITATVETIEKLQVLSHLR